MLCHLLAAIEGTIKATILALGNLELSQDNFIGLDAFDTERLSKGSLTHQFSV